MKKWSLGIAILAGAVMLALPAARDGATENGGLRSASEFASITDPAERSAALFTEAGKVILHPRCVNCHPAGDSPLQGESGEPHEPPVRRGTDNHGVIGMQCETCHHDANFDPGRVPGALHWGLAPRSMAWEGLSLTEVCEQIKDPQRNGQRTLDDIVHHMKKDPLVAYGWEPGADREPVPGTHEVFGELIAAWAETGAVCPAG